MVSLCYFILMYDLQQQPTVLVEQALKALKQPSSIVLVCWYVYFLKSAYYFAVLYNTHTHHYLQQISLSVVPCKHNRDAHPMRSRYNSLLMHITTSITAKVLLEFQCNNGSSSSKNMEIYYKHMSRCVNAFTTKFFICNNSLSIKLRWRHHKHAPNVLTARSA